MQAINLLPKELRRDPTIELKRVVRTALITMLIGILVLAFVTLYFNNYFKEKEIESISAEITALEPMVQKVNKLKARIEDTNRRIGVYREILERPLPWPELLRDIAFNMPTDVWFTEVKTSTIAPPPPPADQQEASNSTLQPEVFLSIKGYAPSLSSIGVFLLHLNNISGLESVNLIIARAADEAKFGKYMMEFEIKAKVKQIEGGTK